jgi:hypothetical protein
MANKALAKRQKLSFRVEPSHKGLKPRNPVAVAAKQRAAGPHKKAGSTIRHSQERMLKKMLDDPDSDKS